MECIEALNLILSYFIEIPECRAMLHDARYWPVPSLSVYLKYFVITLVLEAPVYALILYRLGWKKATAALVFVNLLTHPLIVYVWPLIARQYNLGYRELILIGEGLVPLIEALALKFILQDRFVKILFIAYLANFASWYLALGLDQLVR